MKSTATITVFNEAAFISWIMTASPFEAVIYYRGYLAGDKFATATARRAFEFAAKEFIWLFQRRLGDEQYDYIAVRRPEMKKSGADPLDVPPYYAFRAVAANTGDPIDPFDLRAAE